MKKMAQKKQHEAIEHTADIGLCVRSKTLRQLFIQAARGMFSIIALPKHPLKKATTTRDFNIEIFASNQEELLVGWLSELVSLSDIHSLIFFRFQIHKLTQTSITATVTAEKISQRRYELKTQIKAVTYHELKIERIKQQIVARVLFDI